MVVVLSFFEVKTECSENLQQTEDMHLFRTQVTVTVEGISIWSLPDCKGLFKWKCTVFLVVSSFEQWDKINK